MNVCIHNVAFYFSVFQMILFIPKPSLISPLLMKHKGEKKIIFSLNAGFSGL